MDYNLYREVTFQVGMGKNSIHARTILFNADIKLKALLMPTSAIVFWIGVPVSKSRFRHWNCKRIFQRTLFSKMNYKFQVSSKSFFTLLRPCISKNAFQKNSKHSESSTPLCTHWKILFNKAKDRKWLLYTETMVLGFRKNSPQMGRVRSFLA